MDWHKTLSDDKRESLFSLMRKLYEEQLRYEEKSRYDPWRIPVGSAHFDDLLCSVIISEYLNGINRGLDLDECKKEVYKTSRLCISKHNSKSTDINWPRADIGGDSFSDLIYTRILCSQSATL